MRIRVSAGYYVRALAHALGEALDTGAHLCGLHRTRAGPFDLSGAVTWQALATAPRGSLTSALLPVDRLLPALPAAHLTAETARKARHGQSVQATVTGPSTTGPIRLLDDAGHLLGIAESDAAGDPPGQRILRPIVVLS